MPPDRKPEHGPALSDKLQELEQLLPEKHDPATVPVLDDVVEDGEVDDLPAPGKDLEARLQQRLEAELGDLVEVLKRVISRCIREELQGSASPDKEGSK